MKYILTYVILAFAFLSNTANATEVVYSMRGLEHCKDIATYNTSISRHASRERIEKKLMSKGTEDKATHVYITKFIDNTGQGKGKGKGIKVKAVGLQCK